MKAKIVRTDYIEPNIHSAVHCRSSSHIRWNLLLKWHNVGALMRVGLSTSLEHHSDYSFVDVRPSANNKQADTRVTILRHTLVVHHCFVFFSWRFGLVTGLTPKWVATRFTDKIIFCHEIVYVNFRGFLLKWNPGLFSLKDKLTQPRDWDMGK